MLGVAAWATIAARFGGKQYMHLLELLRWCILAVLLIIIFHFFLYISVQFTFWSWVLFFFFYPLLHSFPCIYVPQISAKSPVLT